MYFLLTEVSILIAMYVIKIDPIFQDIRLPIKIFCDQYSRCWRINICVPFDRFMINLKRIDDFSVLKINLIECKIKFQSWSLDVQS